MKITLEQGDFGTYLICAEDGSDILIQIDTDFPSVAQTFGWDGEWDDIAGAVEYLDEHIGVSVEDPGYFE